MTPAQQVKAQILQRVRELTNQGRHLEASKLFREHFEKNTAKDRAGSGSLKGACPRFDSKEVIIYLLTSQWKQP